MSAAMDTNTETQTLFVELLDEGTVPRRAFRWAKANIVYCLP